MNNVLMNLISTVQTLFSKSDIVECLSLVVAVISLILSKYAINRSRWGVARDFLVQVDSEEMRKARKIVYTYYDPEKLSSNPIDDDTFDEAITRVIAFYDGNARLVLKGYLPWKIFDNTTLITAARFFDIAFDYINKRRTEESQRGHNEIYAYNYAKFLASSYTRKRIEEAESLKKTCDEVYNKAHKNSSLIGSDDIKKNCAEKD